MDIRLKFRGILNVLVNYYHPNDEQINIKLLKMLFEIFGLNQKSSFKYRIMVLIFMVFNFIRWFIALLIIAIDVKNLNIELLLIVGDPTPFLKIFSYYND